MRFRSVVHRRGGARAGKEFWLNDFNAPLAKLLSLIVNSPKELAKFYANSGGPTMRMRWSIIISARVVKPHAGCALLLYLLAPCVKGAVRYNGEGLFNQSPHKRRLGTQPETMQANIDAISALLRSKPSSLR